MPKFGKRSMSKLETCHEDLQQIFYQVIKHFDCTVTEGHRGEEEQNKYFEEGKSKVKFPKGRHNSYPSRAIDVAPYPIDYNDLDRFYYFAGFVKGVAAMLDIPIRWGGDWNDDTQVKDTGFKDLPHFELK
tara:strand:+ start:1305 stop:1694 length:390 start_codon:yes stop_codon:yes gene_type:complete